MRTRNFFGNIWTFLFALVMATASMQAFADLDGIETDPSDLTSLDNLDTGSLDSVGNVEDSGEVVGADGEVVEFEGGGDEVIYTTLMDTSEEPAVDDSVEIPFDGEVVEFTPVDGEVNIYTAMPLMNSAGPAGGVSDTVVEQIGAAGTMDAELTIVSETPEAVLSAAPAATEAASTPLATGGQVRISGGHLVGGGAAGSSLQ